MTPDQEKELLSRIKDDPRLFGILFDHYYKPIFAYIFRRVADYDVSRDIAAETFLKAFLKINSFRWTGVSVSAWLYKIATNEINYFFRKKKYTPYHFGSVLNYDKINFNGTATTDERTALEEELKLHDDFLLIQTNLKKLDVKYQEVIALRYFENKDNREISDILNKPEGTVKSLLSRGLEKLRKMIYS